MCVQSLSHVQLCDPMDCSLSGSSVHRICQARILEWVAISYSRWYFWPRDETHISCIFWWQMDSLPLHHLGSPAWRYTRLLFEPLRAYLVKNLPTNSRDTGGVGLIPGSGRCPRGGNGNPLQYSCLENSMDRRARWATVHGVTESDITETEHACIHACPGVSKWPSSIATISSPFCTRTLLLWKLQLFKQGLTLVLPFFFKKQLIYFNWSLITLHYCSGFCHTLTWINHEYTCVPHPEPPSHLPPHPISQGHPRAPALSTLFHASDLDWWSISRMIIYMFQCYSLKSSHPRLLFFLFSFFFSKYTLG